MEKKEELDRDGFYRVIEGNDVSYSFIALGRPVFQSEPKPKLQAV